MSALVMGHMNPDTDSIMSAIAVADLFTKRGIPAKAVAQGKCAPDTQFALDKFGLTAPEIVTDVSGQKLILVDFSDLAQAPKGMDSVDLIGIVDHHKLGDVTTINPVEIWTWPVGCTATVIKSMYEFYGIEIPKNIAAGLVCAVLTDTVMYKSPTVTDADKKAVDELAKMAGIDDVMALGMEVFKVKSAVEDSSITDLVFRDYKDFDMNGNKVGIGQLEVIDIALLDSVKKDLYEEISRVKAEGRHSVMLMLTDIMKEGTQLMFVSDDPSKVEKAFDVKVEGSEVWLEKVMSRKKQMVPNLETAFKA